MSVYCIHSRLEIAMSWHSAMNMKACDNSLAKMSEDNICVCKYVLESRTIGSLSG
jgi:hypothetical protein